MAGATCRGRRARQIWRYVSQWPERSIGKPSKRSLHKHDDEGGMEPRMGGVKMEAAEVK